MIRRLLLVALVAVVLALVIRRGALPSSVSTRARGPVPTVVLVHGLAGSPANWRAVDEALSPDLRVILVDLPGHGIARMPDTLTLEGAAALLDHAIVDRASGPVVLVGHSIGGLVALEEALLHPERVAGLVLVETALRPQLTASDARQVMHALDDDWAGTLHRIYRGFARDSLQGSRVAEQALETDPAALRPWISLALHADLRAQVGRLHVPTLALFAPHSWPPDEPWAATAESLGYARARGLTARRIPDCGHYVMLDQPIELADAIRRFTFDLTATRTASR